MNKPHDDFTLDDVTRFRAFLQDGENAPRNIQYGMSIVRDYITYQMSIHHLDFPLRLFKIKQERSQSHYAVTYKEYLRMIDVLPMNEPQSLQRKAMLMLLYDTGMRGGELLRMRISHIKDRQAIIMNEKNHRSRLISWTAETDRIIKHYLPLRKQLPATDDFLFVSFKWRPCKPLTTRQLERIIIDVRKKAHLRAPIRPHSFRHGFVHRQLDVGRPITTIAQMLGHSSSMNVMNYAQLSGKEIRAAWGIS